MVGFLTLEREEEDEECNALPGIIKEPVGIPSISDSGSRIDESMPVSSVPVPVSEPYLGGYEEYSKFDGLYSEDNGKSKEVEASLTETGTGSTVPSGPRAESRSIDVDRMTGAEASVLLFETNNGEISELP